MRKMVAEETGDNKMMSETKQEDLRKTKDDSDVGV